MSVDLIIKTEKDQPVEGQVRHAAYVQTRTTSNPNPSVSIPEKYTHSAGKSDSRQTQKAKSRSKTRQLNVTASRAILFAKTMLATAFVSALTSHTMVEGARTELQKTINRTNAMNRQTDESSSYLAKITSDQEIAKWAISRGYVSADTTETAHSKKTFVAMNEVGIRHE